MTWFKKKETSAKEEKAIDALWSKCNVCQEIIYKRELERNLNVCPKCGYHFPIQAQKRLAIVADEGSFKEFDRELIPVDLISFRDLKRYSDRLHDAQQKTGLKDAFITGRCEIHQLPAMVGVFEFDFLGGSLGSVVGEKIARMVEKAMDEKIGAIIFTSSGGARMQEGILSLMQMAKTSAALSRLRRERLPYISVLTDPTTGGVTASFGMLGDIILAEPGALIGFAGPRVIKETIKADLPPGFQRAEYLLQHGMIDLIVERRRLKETLGKFLDLLYH
ncbi:MAG: acetyl-CoA carboxylase, carboxyltransferase subunit beta [Deltaproteobacteria bacterium]|jgi:acetyl-CoA carboxylase carboxyl transferase subunit beta|nr:acetyl-CoA carboxylase, carboxyltransferase subunit beta [Deltaproteobacteria bacterium]